MTSRPTITALAWVTLPVVLLVDAWLRVLAQGSESVWAFGPLAFGSFRNSGAIFSIPLPADVTLAVAVAALAVVALTLFVVRTRVGGNVVLALVAVGAGGASNVVDRIAHGSVTDYVSFGSWFPVFNLADLVIVAGLVALVLVTMRRRLDDVPAKT